MVRHLSFKEIGEFRAVLVKEAPAGVYCSNSLYENPSAEMQSKGWIRAELIFDIDAGALNQPCRKVHDIWLCKGCGKKEYGLRPEICPKCRSNKLLELPWSCPLCLEAAKKETFKLLDFLEFDFGIPNSSVKVYFSGNAGYHLCIQGGPYEVLGTSARAEIADYVRAQGILPSFFDSSRLGPSEPGWTGRIARYNRDCQEDDKMFQKAGGVYEKRIHALVQEFSKKEFEAFLARAISENIVMIDAAVTTDIHRIFRMPETLNNKTGMVKRDCGSDLSSFDPLIEAIALKDEDEKTLVYADMCPKIQLGGNTYGPFLSETKELPLSVGVYIVCKGAGKFVIKEKIPTEEERSREIPTLKNGGRGQ